jgi:hypothetical protein
VIRFFCSVSDIFLLGVDTTVLPVRGAGARRLLGIEKQTAREISALTQVKISTLEDTLRKVRSFGYISLAWYCLRKAGSRVVRISWYDTKAKKSAVPRPKYNPWIRYSRSLNVGWSRVWRRKQDSYMRVKSFFISKWTIISSKYSFFCSFRRLIAVFTGICYLTLRWYGCFRHILFIEPTFRRIRRE